MKKNTSFGKFAELWDSKAGNSGSFMVQESLKAVFSMLKPIKGKKIYEIACGNGFLSRRFVAEGAKEVWASDIAPELIDIAKTKYDPQKIKYLVKEGTDFKGIPKNSFDAVVIHQGVFFIKEINTLFAGISKILKPKGMLVFTIIHPLFSLARKDMGAKTSMGQDIDVFKIGNRYLTTYTTQVMQTGEVNGKEMTGKYYTYNRPLHVFVNTLSEYGLYVSEIAEPKSVGRVEGKKVKTNIPSGMVIKAAKM